MRRTERLHLSQPFLTTCEARVTGINPDPEKGGIALDQTIAFGEGGGQEGDHGWLITDEGLEVPFIDTQKGYGRLLLLPDFPSIQVDTPVYHKVASEHLSLFQIGQPVRVIIDTERRIRLTISHTGIHAVLMGLQTVKDSLYPLIRGCHIKPDGARLDFSLDNDSKFGEEQIIKAREFTNTIIKENWPAQTFAHPKEPEAMFWQAGDTVYACGGTHLPFLGDVGEVFTSKKSLGAGMQRVSFSFPNAIFRKELFTGSTVK